MKRTIISTALALFCLVAEGQVVIYKLKLTVTGTGRGVTATTTPSGYLLMNPADGTLTVVFVSNSQKIFAVTTLDDWYVSTVEGPGKAYTVLSEATTTNDAAGNLQLDTATAKGINSSVDIGSAMSVQNPWSVPKTIQLVWRRLHRADSGQSELSELNGTLTLDLKRTRQSNQAGNGIDDAADAIRTELAGQGYTESD
jgi:hypothetical protein